MYRPSEELDQHATGQYATGQHATGQYATGQYATGQYAIGQHATGQYATGQHIPNKQPPTGLPVTSDTVLYLQFNGLGLILKGVDSGSRSIRLVVDSDGLRFFHDCQTGTAARYSPQRGTLVTAATTPRFHFLRLPLSSVGDVTIDSNTADSGNPVALVHIRTCAGMGTVTVICRDSAAGQSLTGRGTTTCRFDTANAITKGVSAFVHRWMEDRRAVDQRRKFSGTVRLLGYGGGSSGAEDTALVSSLAGDSHGRPDSGRVLDRLKTEMAKDAKEEAYRSREQPHRQQQQLRRVMKRLSIACLEAEEGKHRDRRQGLLMGNDDGATAEEGGSVFYSRHPWRSKAAQELANLDVKLAAGAAELRNQAVERQKKFEINMALLTAKGCSRSDTRDPTSHAGVGVGGRTPFGADVLSSSVLRRADDGSEPWRRSIRHSEPKDASVLAPRCSRSGSDGSHRSDLL